MNLEADVSSPANKKEKKHLKITHTQSRTCLVPQKFDHSQKQRKKAATCMNNLYYSGRLFQCHSANSPLLVLLPHWYKREEGTTSLLKILTKYLVYFVTYKMIITKRSICINSNLFSFLPKIYSARYDRDICSGDRTPSCIITLCMVHIYI